MIPGQLGSHETWLLNHSNSQILKQIWEAVSNNYHAITWLEILEFRENFSGKPDVAIRGLNQQWYHKMPRNHYCLPQTLMPEMMSHNQYSLASNSNKVPCIQFIHPDYHYSNNGMFSLMNHHHLPHETKYGQNDAGQMHTCYMPPATTAPCRVPIAQLINIDPPSYERSCSKKVQGLSPEYSHVDSYIHSVGMDDRRDYEKMDKKNCKSHKESANTENWDYVMQELDSKGYSKDLGDRGDITSNTLHHRTRDLDTRSMKHKNVRSHQEMEEKSTRHVNRGFFEESNGRLSRTLNNKENGKRGLMPDVLLTDLKMESNSTQELNKKVHRNQSKGVTEIMESMKEIRVDGLVEKDKDKWNCASCTYLNAQENLICEMCNKSRHKGNEDTPLASGGKECPKCTLINERDSVACIACETSLQDSPTYI